jgi:hypothetical protein
MMAHELLRQTALIVAQGWSKGCDARDSAGRKVPLYTGATLILGAGWSKGRDARDNTERIVPLDVGDARAKINPQAAAFSPYCAICKGCGG